MLDLGLANEMKFTKYLGLWLAVNAYTIIVLIFKP